MKVKIGKNGVETELKARQMKIAKAGHSMWILRVLMDLNLQMSSKKSSAISLQFFIWEIRMIIFLKRGLCLTSDSSVLSFCFAFRGDLTVIRTSSSKGISKMESTYSAVDIKINV